MRRKTSYKHHRLTSLSIGNSIVYSYAINGNLRFLSGADGLGIHTDDGRSMEFDIDLDLPDNNQFRQKYSFSDISVLFVQMYNYKNGIITNHPRANMIDFNRCLMSIPYAVRFAKDGTVLTINQTAADKFATKYPQIGLPEFIAKTLHEFSKQHSV